MAKDIKAKKALFLKKVLKKAKKKAPVKLEKKSEEEKGEKDEDTEEDGKGGCGKMGKKYANLAKKK
jgi:hypothetical protein